MQDRAGFTQLIRCAKNGDFENCCKLLKANANLHICDNGGWTSLHIACSQKYSDIVELMISHGANVNARTNTGSTPLHEAASSGCEKSVRALLEAGANVNSRNKKGKSAIDLC
ncbi:ankyrin, partial [Neoconidiobolus thromboides FSU 785]